MHFLRATAQVQPCHRPVRRSSPGHVLLVGTHASAPAAATTAGACDDAVAACYCPSSTPYGRVPAAPDAPPGSPPVRRGRPMGFWCQPNKTEDGRATAWGTVDPELLWGPHGWCTAAEPAIQCPCPYDGWGGKNCEEPFEQVRAGWVATCVAVLRCHSSQRLQAALPLPPRTARSSASTSATAAASASKGTASAIQVRRRPGSSRAHMHLCGCAVWVLTCARHCRLAWNRLRPRERCRGHQPARCGAAAWHPQWQWDAGTGMTCGACCCCCCAAAALLLLQGCSRSAPG